MLLGWLAFTNAGAAVEPNKKTFMRASAVRLTNEEPRPSGFFQFWIAPILRAGVLICLSLAPQFAAAQMIDLNHTGMSDVWEQLYGASGLPPNGDADGDGSSNFRPR